MNGYSHNEIIKMVRNYYGFYALGVEHIGERINSMFSLGYSLENFI